MNKVAVLFYKSGAALTDSVVIDSDHGSCGFGLLLAVFSDI